MIQDIYIGILNLETFATKHNEPYFIDFGISKQYIVNKKIY